MNSLHRQAGIENMMMQATVLQIQYRPLFEGGEVARYRIFGQIMQSQDLLKMRHIVFGCLPVKVLN